MIDLTPICVEAATTSVDAACADLAPWPDAGPIARVVVDAGGAPVGVLSRARFHTAMADPQDQTRLDHIPIARIMDDRPCILDRLARLNQLTELVLNESGTASENDGYFVVVGRQGNIVGLAPSTALLRLLTFELQRRTERAAEAQRVAEAAAFGQSRFIANLTHELRTPLNGVIGFGQLLTQETLGPLGAAEYKLYAQDIVDSGQHLIAIINDILDLAKIEAGRIELDERFVDLRELAGRSIRMVGTLARKKQISITAPVSPGHWTVRADERRFQQALVNLLSNAIKFTPKGGEIGIEFAADDARVWIEVWDTGCGVAEADMEKLFKPFEQIRTSVDAGQPGTGLGLTITKALLQAHGGDVEVESEVDVGTRARLILPGARMLAKEFAWSAFDKVEFLDPPANAKAS